MMVLASKATEGILDHTISAAAATAAAAVLFLLPSFALLLQFRLPVQPPMALLASKTSEGMLGLRWNKLKMGPAHCSNTRSVQVGISSCGYITCFACRHTLDSIDL